MSDLPNSWLYEYTYDDIRKAVDLDFINHGEYRKETERRGIRYIPFDSSTINSASHVGRLTSETADGDNRLVYYAVFKSPLSPRSVERGYSSEHDAWYQTIAFLDFEQSMNSPGETMINRVGKMMYSGDIAIHCDCPSFKYWGYWYIMNALDAAVYSQGIEPNVRNPQRRGVICKHLDIVLKVMPFYRSDFTRDIKKQGFDIPRSEGFTDEQRLVQGSL